MADFTVKEYLIKDKDGKLKIWQKGKLIDYQKWLAQQASVSTDKPNSSNVTSLVDTGMEAPMLAPPSPAIIPSKEKIEDKNAKKYSLEKILDKIVADLKLTLSDEEFAKFRQILFSFFRGIRSVVNVRDMLQKSKPQGGLELADPIIDAIIKLVKIIDAKVKDAGGEVVSIDLEENKIKSDPKIKETIDQMKKTQIQKQSFVDRAASASKASDLSSEAQMIFGSDNDEEQVDNNSLEGFDQSSAETFIPTQSFKKRIQTIPASKVPMQEVKRFSKLVGPIDELRQLTIKVFRKLGNSPEEIVNKIEQRIDGLSGDSMEERLKAIKAWQSSPVYESYVKLGKLSLDEGVSVENIISKKAQASVEDILTPHEFAAILDLNRRLRF